MTYLDGFIMTYEEDDIPSYVSYNDDGSIREQEWCKNNLRHRECGPAYIVQDTNRILYWYRNGVLHREDGPAIEEYDGDGVKREECYYLNGIWSRKEGPSFVTYHPTGHLRSEYWITNNIEDRDDGPSKILYDKSGRKIKETWYKNGSIHRLFGPAIIIYNKLGGIRYKEYYIGDTRINVRSDEEFIEKDEHKWELMNFVQT